MLARIQIDDVWDDGPPCCAGLGNPGLQHRSPAPFFGVQLSAWWVGRGVRVRVSYMWGALCHDVVASPCQAARMGQTRPNRSRATPTFVLSADTFGDAGTRLPAGFPKSERIPCGAPFAAPAGDPLLLRVGTSTSLLLRRGARTTASGASIIRTCSATASRITFAGYLGGRA